GGQYRQGERDLQVRVGRLQRLHGLATQRDRRRLGDRRALDVEVDVLEAVGVDDRLVLGGERADRRAGLGELDAAGAAEGVLHVAAPGTQRVDLVQLPAAARVVGVEPAGLAARRVDERQGEALQRAGGGDVSEDRGRPGSHVDVRGDRQGAARTAA